jgi:hypothetical protein
VKAGFGEGGGWIEFAEAEERVRVGCEEDGEVGEVLEVCWCHVPRASIRSWV